MSNVLVVVDAVDPDNVDNKLTATNIEALRKLPASSIISLLCVIAKIPPEMLVLPSVGLDIEPNEYRKGHAILENIVSELGIPVAHKEIIEGRPAANGRVDKLKPDIVLTQDPEKFVDPFSRLWNFITRHETIPIMTPETYVEQELEKQPGSSYSHITQKGGRGEVKEEPEVKLSQEKTAAQEQKDTHKVAPTLSEEKKDKDIEEDLDKNKPPSPKI